MANVIKLTLPPRVLEDLVLTLAQSFESGLTLLEHVTGPAGQLLPAELRRNLEQGARENRPTSEILQRLGILSASALALLRAAESRGEPAVALRALAARVQQQRKSLRRIALGLTYPALMILSTIWVQPLPKVVTEGPEGYFQAVLGPTLLFFAVLGLGIFAVPRLHPDHPLLVALSTASRLIPPLAYAARHRALATFADVLGAGISAGLSFRESIPLAIEATDHPAFRGTSAAILERISAGKSLTDALTSALPLSPDVAARIAHGERVGKLDEILPTISAEHAAKATSAVAATIAVTLLMAGVAVLGYVAFEVASGWNQIFESIEGPLKSLSDMGGNLEGLDLF